MVNSKTIIMTGFILIAGIIAFLIFYQSEEDRVIKQFDILAETIEKIPGENQIIAAAKAKKLTELLTGTIDIQAPAYSFSKTIPTSELSTYSIVTRSKYTELSLSFHDFAIDFPDNNTAHASLTVVMEGTATAETFLEDIHELNCTLKKIEDTWRISKVEVVEVLEM